MTLYAERLLPHNIEAEEALIGSILIDPECITRLAPILGGDDFYRERNRICYDAAVALASRNAALDQTTLASELSRREELDSVGGMAYLSHLVSITPTSVHAEDYADVVSRTSTMRKLIQAASRISELGYNDTDDVDATFRQAEDALYAVRGATRRADFRSFRDIFDQYLQDQAASGDMLPGSDIPIMSGFGDLDETLGGIQRSDMLILGARPSVGKSTLALNMAVQAAKAGQVVAIFSLEMTGDQLAMRAVSAEAGIDSHRLRLHLITENEEQRVMHTIGELSELPVYIDDTPYQTMTDIRGKARRLALEKGLDLVVVDYLQLIQGQQQRTQVHRVQEITEISRSLKVMAGELNAAVIACSQLNRLVENRPNHRPQLLDLRDSGSIEQDADVVLFIHREGPVQERERVGPGASGSALPPGHSGDHNRKTPEGPHRQRAARIPGQPGPVRVGSENPRGLSSPGHFPDTSPPATPAAFSWSRAWPTGTLK